MVSWLEELEWRESEARERAAELRRRLGELTEQLEVEERLLSRLQVTRETMLEILGTGVDAEPATAVGEVVGASDGEPEPVSGGGSPIGVVLVPPRNTEIAVSVLPQDYRDILEVLADAGRGLRCGHVAAALGLAVEDRSAVESLRSKLKRLVARNWLDEEMPGLFVLAEGVDVTA